jgi:hypothetical protein
MSASADAGGGGDDGGRNALLEAIKNKKQLRSKDESNAIAEKVEKKPVEKARPLTMAEDLKMRLTRRNNALSGKTDQEQKKRDSVIIEQAKANPPAQSEEKKLPSVKSLFASIDGNESNSASASSSPASKPSNNGPIVKTVRKKTNKDDSDDSSDESVLSIDEPIAPKKTATNVPFKITPPAARRPADSDSDDYRQPAPVPTPAPARSSSVTEAGPNRRSSGFNEDLLTKVQAAQNAAKSNNDDDDDWDE